jgi:hypothetical protein
LPIGITATQFRNMFLKFRTVQGFAKHPVVTLMQRDTVVIDTC